MGVAVNPEIEEREKVGFFAHYGLPNKRFALQHV